MMTLDKILQLQGFGTRKYCRCLVADGLVRVGGERVTDCTAGFIPDGLQFSVNGEDWVFRRHVYLALHKPAGIECSRRPTHHRGVLTLLPDPFTLRDVQPVGRLDHGTTGLLLLSDDGSFIHANSHPKRHVPKTYVATTRDLVTPQLLARLEAGVKLLDEPDLLSARVRQIDDHRIEMTIDMGKYHQVKRMLAAAGHHCVALRRSAIGSLTLDELDLAEGEWRYLEPNQLEKLNAYG